MHNIHAVYIFPWRVSRQVYGRLKNKISLIPNNNHIIKISKMLKHIMCLKN